METKSWKKQSNINILFGDKVHNDSPINIEMIIDFCSQKHENAKFNLNELLNQKIINGSVVIQLLAKTGYGSQLADKITSYLKTDKQYIKLSQQGKINIKAIGKQKKAYLIITSQQFQSKIQQISKLFDPIKDLQKSQNNQVKLNLKSSNDFETIRKFLDIQGAVRAIFDSLELNFSFKKTKTVQTFLSILFSQVLGFKQLQGALKSFQHFNLEVKFQSSKLLDKFEKLKQFGLVQNKIQLQLFSILQGLIDDQAKIYIFNQLISMDLLIMGKGIESFLKALFEGQQEKQEK